MARRLLEVRHFLRIWSAVSLSKPPFSLSRFSRYQYLLTLCRRDLGGDAGHRPGRQRLRRRPNGRGLPLLGAICSRFPRLFTLCSAVFRSSPSLPLSLFSLLGLIWSRFSRFFAFVLLSFAHLRFRIVGTDHQEEGSGARRDFIPLHQRHRRRSWLLPGAFRH